EADGDGDLGRVLESIAGAGLSTLLAREHPQVAAVILAHLDAGRAAEALVGLTDEQQADLLDRVARLDRIPSELQSELGLVLKGEIQDAVRPEGAAVGGPRTVAEILNCVDKPVEERLLGRFDESDGDLGQTIRTLMFTFEDCIKLEQRSLQTLLKEVSREDLLLALKTATPALLEKILANVSSRAAEILREDLAAMGAVRVSDVEAAQAHHRRAAGAGGGRQGRDRIEGQGRCPRLRRLRASSRCVRRSRPATTVSVRSPWSGAPRTATRRAPASSRTWRRAGARRRRAERPSRRRIRRWWRARRSSSKHTSAASRTAAPGPRPACAIASRRSPMRSPRSSASARRFATGCRERSSIWRSTSRAASSSARSRSTAISGSS